MIRIPALMIAIYLLQAGPAALASADHHMHTYSEPATRVWAAMCAVAEDGCEDEQPLPMEALPADAVIRALDAARLDKGVLLSLGYWFGAASVAGSEFDDHRYVRAENEFVASQVSRFPDRLVGFFSVNPLLDYAIDEVTYWAEHGGLAGLKLHLANSGFDFGDAEHMRRLRAVISVVNDHRMPVVIHLRHRGSGYGYEQAALFIDQVARHAPDVTFQLAHLSGWGGYDDATDGAVQAFLDAFEDGVLERERFWFDLAAVVDTEMADDVVSRLRARMDDVGFDRLLFATDWDEIDPVTYIATLKERLQLSDAEAAQLMSNNAPYLH